MTHCIRVLLTSVFVALLAAPAAGVTIDFEEFAHGQEVTSSKGVTITTLNIGGGPDLGVAFDTNLTGTSDSDLERGSGWSGGNLAPNNVDLGNILIIQEHLTSCREEASILICSDPDDEGTRPAGSIAFDYSSLGTFNSFEMDLIDVEESTVAEPGMIEFFLGADFVQSKMFSDFIPPDIYGNNTANHLFVLAGISFNRAVIHLGGSGGIDNITASVVPEPSAAMLFVAGFALVHGRIRRLN